MSNRVTQLLIGVMFEFDNFDPFIIRIFFGFTNTVENLLLARLEHGPLTHEHEFPPLFEDEYCPTFPFQLQSII